MTDHYVGLSFFPFKKYMNGVGEKEVSHHVCMFVLCYLTFYFLLFVLLATLHAPSSIKENFYCQQFFSGRHYCSFRFVIIQDRKCSTAEERAGWSPGRASPRQSSPHTLPHRADSVLASVARLLVICPLGSFEFCSEAGAQIGQID